jgi:hypothetical protein
VGICNYISGSWDAVNGLSIFAAVLPKTSNPRPVGKLLYLKLPLPAWITKEATDSLQRGAQSSTARGTVFHFKSDTRLELCNVTGHLAGSVKNSRPRILPTNSESYDIRWQALSPCQHRHFGPLVGSKASDKPELPVDGKQWANQVMRRISLMTLDNGP